ncbi:FIG00450379: hypothetical protein [hydrothermal vent metagenome]|uniref:DUF2948 domain-containing protein n=1 Tax=hydrothermal vent metagenome TaxID=652676 RepID=A0A3B0U218_9ZZZZ
MDEDAPLKLAALDEDDLSVLSAHLQDAVLKVGEMQYLPAEHRFAVTLNRFDWLHDSAADRLPYRRRQAALVIDRVAAVRSQAIKRGADDAVLVLLATEFSPGEAPSGHIDLIFAGGGAVRLEVECIEVRLADLGPEWETGSQPAHDLSETVSEQG